MVTVKELVKGFVRKVKELDNGTSSLGGSPCAGSVDGIFYEVDNDFIKENNCRVAVVSLYADGRKVIKVDDYFFKLSPLAQKCVLYHEQAHIELGHLEPSFFDMYQIDRSFNASLGIVDYKEREADQRAALQVGVFTYISFLYELSNVRGIAKKEILERISLLQSL